MAQTTRRQRLRPGYGYVAGERVTRTVRGAYKIRGAVRARIIDALASGAVVDKACKLAGVGRTSFYHHRERSAVFDRDCVKAMEIGFAVQKLPLERRERFLAICSWFGNIDLARDFAGLYRADLARIFAADPDFRDEVIDECKRAFAFNGTDPTRQENIFVAMRERLLPYMDAMDTFD